MPTAAAITINGDFIVPPTGGNIDLAEAATNMVFYQNTLNHSTGSNALVDTGSTGFEFFQSGYQIVVDGNTVNNTLNGVEFANSRANVPVAFDEVINGNAFNSVRVGVIISPDEYTSYANYYGVIVRDNLMIGSSENSAIGVAQAGLQLVNTDGSTASASLAVFEKNTVTGFPVGVEDSPDPDFLVRDNGFYNGTTGIVYYYSSSNLLLQGNFYSNFQSDYSSPSPQPVLESTQNVFYMTSSGKADALQIITLQNDGASQVNVQFATNAPIWLTVQASSDTINPESSSPSSGTDAITLIADPSQLTAGCWPATITITYDGGLYTKTLTVYFVVS